MTLLSTTANRGSPQSPARPVRAWSWSTGQLGRSCRRRARGWRARCVRVRAFRWAGAIGLAAPEHHVLLTQVGHDWTPIRARVNTFRGAMRRSGAEWRDVIHVEPNPQGCGHHIHAWQWGSTPNLPGVVEAAQRAGMGSFADVLQPRRETAGQPLSYGMKTVLEGSPASKELPARTARFLEINGGRLAHAPPGVWRDEAGQPP